MLVNNNNYCPLVYRPYVTYGQRKLFMTYLEFFLLIYAVIEKYKTSKLLNVLYSNLFSQTSLSRERFLSSELYFTVELSFVTLIAFSFLPINSYMHTDIFPVRL